MTSCSGSSVSDFACPACADAFVTINQLILHLIDQHMKKHDRHRRIIVECWCGLSVTERDAVMDRDPVVTANRMVSHLSWRGVQAHYLNCALGLVEKQR